MTETASHFNDREHARAGLIDTIKSALSSQPADPAAAVADMILALYAPRVVHLMRTGMPHRPIDVETSADLCSHRAVVLYGPLEQVNRGNE